jgi:hypothetical protein
MTRRLVEESPLCILPPTQFEHEQDGNAPSPPYLARRDELEAKLCPFVARQLIAPSRPFLGPVVDHNNFVRLQPRAVQGASYPRYGISDGIFRI